jgi:ketosteroid isomerase-like protein
MATKEATMTTQQVADRFVEYANKNNWTQIQAELFSDDAESIEPPHSMGLKTVRGKAAIKQKGKQFQQMVEEVHSGYTGDPIVAGNHFSVTMGMDVTMKGAGRVKMDEIAVYQVKDGQIVKEQFFY